MLCIVLTKRKDLQTFAGLVKYGATNLVIKMFAVATVSGCLSIWHLIGIKINVTKIDLVVHQLMIGSQNNKFCIIRTAVYLLKLILVLIICYLNWKCLFWCNGVFGISNPIFSSNN